RERSSRRLADQVLADEQIVAAVYDALAKRHPKSRSRGRLGTPAEVGLRLLILRSSSTSNWSMNLYEAELLAHALPYRRLTALLTDCNARLGADVDWSGRTEARTGLRMMPTSPRSPLSFRTAGFPRYGWKAGLSDGTFPIHRPTFARSPPAPGR